MSESGAPYDLPSLWEADGAAPSIARWERRRERIRESFANAVYGHTPTGGRLDDVTVVSRRADALGGSAIRIEADLILAGPLGVRRASLLVYAPVSDTPVPAFLGLNFWGNHATTTDTDVRRSDAVEAVAKAHGSPPTERGSDTRAWPYPLINGRGYAVATIWYEELEIDLPGYADTGVRGLFGAPSGLGQPAWGAIGAWAWSLSRALDALGAIDEIDQTAVIAVGHSRLGKTALWAAAQDTRFAGVVSNESGCGGASLFRHVGVEDIRVITTARPHWFTPRFAEYRGADHLLPVDQHQLVALVAPRPTHVASATDDPGADPYGEFLSTLHATPIFELYGSAGTAPTDLAPPGADLATEHALRVPYPTPGVRVGERLSYHLREGRHAMVEEDWRHVLDFADQHWTNTG
ncbi:glucuronyl esterase domain-containing protein [Sinosporangium siamense]|uniref:glucuronyl esterase domain-containing protein n=1 Tax=Sinosporangium siamense TaxID=1367973 RepID=UPI00194F0FD6|nr:hypothetical protein [Sinosporangium siamense]